MSLGSVKYAPDGSTSGAFERKPAKFLARIDPNGAHPPAAGRYALYISYACPWACRCLSVLKSKGLEDAIAVYVVAPVMAKTRPEVDNHYGWVFNPEYDAACTADPLFNAKSIRELYERTCPPDASLPERFTVPVLVDTVTRTIVCNESSLIMRDLNTQFTAFATRHVQGDLVPAAQLAAIDAMNAANYESVNNGVYKCGFAEKQEPYNEASKALFARLDELDRILETSRFLLGDSPTESDLRLFVTLVRFDPVYTIHFKCSKRRIRDYRNLPGYVRDVYQTLGLQGTVQMKHIMEHYYLSHDQINPFGIIPDVEFDDLEAPHDRAHLGRSRIEWTTL